MVMSPSRLSNGISLLGMMEGEVGYMKRWLQSKPSIRFWGGVDYVQVCVLFVLLRVGPLA